MIVINIITQTIAAFIAVYAFAILFYAPRKHYFGCACIGAVSWLVYNVLTAQGVSSITASLGAAFMLTILARTLAVVREVPTTLFLTTGIFPLVPGAGIYYTAYYLFMHQPSAAGAKGLETFEIALAIVLGIAFGSAIPFPNFKNK